MEFLTFIGHSDYVRDGVGDGVEKWLITGLITWLINAGINVVRLHFIGERSVNEKSTTVMLSNFESATIIRACIRLATIMNISCIAYLIWNFSPLLGILIMWEMVWEMV